VKEWPMWVLLFIAIIVGVMVYAKWHDRDKKPLTNSISPALFKQKALLTENEMEFLLRLENAVPELRFHAQVAMGALLNPVVAPYTREYLQLRGKFSQKIVDYVAQHRADGRIVAIIELDDKTHSAEKDAQRDDMLLQAGYRIVRWHSRNKPDSETIRQTLVEAVIPAA
jgi:hypothetical protein